MGRNIDTLKKNDIFYFDFRIKIILTNSCDMQQTVQTSYPSIRVTYRRSEYKAVAHRVRSTGDVLVVIQAHNGAVRTVPGTTLTSADKSIVDLTSALKTLPQMFQ